MNLSNTKIGNLTITSEYKKGNKIYCVCKCDCGNIVHIRKDGLKNKKDLSCGCKTKINYNDILGKVFGRLTVLEYKMQRTRNLYICRCSCGNTIKTDRNHLLTGHTQSCGCIREEKIKKIKGLDNSRLHSIWNSMHARCYCKTHKSYHEYKDLGVCEEWNSKNKHQGFLNFYKWAMNNGYNDSLTIDRIDNDKGYSPKNCRWVTPYDQCRNLKRNVWIEYKGKNKLLMDWLSELNMTRGKYNNIVWKNKKTPQEAFDIHLYMKYNRKKRCYEYKENNNA